MGLKGTWYSISASEAIQRLRTDASGGLSHKEARRRLLKYGKNRVHPVSRHAFYRSLRHILLDFTAILLLLTTLIGHLFGADENALMLAGIVLAHILIVVLVLYRSEMVLENMERDTLSLTHVVRQGKLFLTEPARLVVGDIVFLSEGDIIPADCRLIRSDDICVDETPVFGADSAACASVHKMADVTLRQQGGMFSAGNMVYAGSTVLQGSCTALVVNTSARCMINRVSNHSSMERQVMPHDKLFRKYGKGLSLSLIVVVFLLIVLQLLQAGSGTVLFSAFMTAMTYAVSCMGEMFSAFCTVAVACGIYSTVKKHGDINIGAMIKRPGAIDQLKKLTVLMIPRRGVLTTRAVSIDYVCTPMKMYRVVGTRYRTSLERVIRLGVVSTGCYGKELVSAGIGKAKLNDEELAILSAARSLQLYNVDLDRRFPLLTYVHADGDLSMFDMALIRGGATGFQAVIRGRPEQILSRCTYYRDGDVAAELSEKRFSKLLESCHTLEREAYTVIAIATKDVQNARAEYAPMYQSDMVFEGFLAFQVPLLQDVAHLISRCRQEGIRPILLDDGEEDSIYFARKIGIIDSPEQVMDYAEYRNAEPGMRFAQAQRGNVYKNFPPAARVELIQSLQNGGAVVGYLGKHMADLQPMEMADVSFAQNVTLSDRAKNHMVPVESEITPGGIAESASRLGCEALKARADVILSEADQGGHGGFSAMLEALTAARSIEQNLLHILYYLIPSSAARLLMMLFGILSGSVVMTAVQVAFSGLLLDCIAVLIICFETADSSILRVPARTQQRLERPKNIMLSSFLYALIWSSCSAAFLAGVTLLFPAFTRQQALSATFLFWSIQQVIFLFLVKQERIDLRPSFKINGIQIVAVSLIAEVFLLFFMYQPLGQRFGIYRFSPSCLLWVCAMVAIFVALTAFAKHLIDNCDRIREMPPDPAVVSVPTSKECTKKTNTPDAIFSERAVPPSQMVQDISVSTPSAADSEQHRLQDLSQVLPMVDQDSNGDFSDLVQDEANSQAVRKLRDNPSVSAQELYPELAQIPLDGAPTEEDDYTEIAYFENQPNSNAELFARFGVDLTQSEKVLLEEQIDLSSHESIKTEKSKSIETES